MTKNKTLLFLLITIIFTLLGWGSLWFLVRNGRIDSSNLLFFGLLVLGGSAPTLSVFVILAVTEGKQGFQAYWNRLCLFRIPFGYYLFPLVFLFLLGILPDILAGALVEKFSSLAQFSWITVPGIFLASLIFGGLEELGWRGLLQHEFQRKYAPWVMHGLIWVIWAAWHYPLFHIPGISQYGLSFWIFSVYALIYSTLLGWLYGRTHSIPLVVFGHMLMNTFATIGILDFLWKDSLDWLTVLIALVVLIGVHFVWPIHQTNQEPTS